MTVGFLVTIAVIIVIGGFANWLNRRIERRQERRRRISDLVDRALAQPAAKPAPKTQQLVPVFKADNLANAVARGWITPAAAGVTERWIAMPPFAVKGQDHVIAIEGIERMPRIGTIQAGDIIYCAVHDKSYAPIEGEVVLTAYCGRFFIRRHRVKQGLWHDAALGTVYATVLGIARLDI